jgi:hypothetical protein
MKNLVNLLIGLSVVSLILAIIARLSLRPILGVQSPGIAAFTVILLLLAIALSVKK